MRLLKRNWLLRILIISSVLFVISSAPSYKHNFQSYPTTNCSRSVVPCGPVIDSVKVNGWPIWFKDVKHACGGIACNEGSSSRLIVDYIAWLLVVAVLDSGYRALKKVR